jgi:hypothetical protein
MRWDAVKIVRQRDLEPFLPLGPSLPASEGLDSKPPTELVGIALDCNAGSGWVGEVPSELAQSGHSRVEGGHSRPHSGQIQWNINLL